jgi:hypothetical protein
MEDNNIYQSFKLHKVQFNIIQEPEEKLPQVYQNIPKDVHCISVQMNKTLEREIALKMINSVIKMITWLFTDIKKCP